MSEFVFGFIHLFVNNIGDMLRKSGNAFNRIRTYQVFEGFVYLKSINVFQKYYLGENV